MKKLFIVVLVMGIVFGFLFAEGSSETQKEIEIHWASIWVGADSKAEIMKTLVSEFNIANSGKYKVIVDEYPNYDAFRSNLNTQITTGQVPDIFALNWDATTKEFYQGKILMDFNKELTGDWGKDFVAGSISEATIDSKTMSVPYEVAYTPIWYNMNILKASGVSEIPSTYEAFFSACEKIKAAGFIPSSQMTGGTNAWTSMLWYSHICASLGGEDVWKKDFKTDPIFVQAAEILKKMYQNGNTSNDAVGGDAGVSGGHYLAGESACFINGPWYIGRVRSDAPEVYKATKAAFAPGTDGMIGFAQTNLAAAATNDSNKKAGVLAFLKWLTKPENVARVTEASGAMIAVKSTSSDTVDPLLAQFNDLGSQAAFILPHFGQQVTTDVLAEFGQALAGMANGQLTSQEFVNQIASVME